MRSLLLLALAVPRGALLLRRVGCGHAQGNDRIMHPGRGSLGTRPLRWLASSSATASRPSFSPRASTEISSRRSPAKASQLRSSVSMEGSRSRSTGRWSNEQDGPQAYDPLQGRLAASSVRRRRLQIAPPYVAAVSHAQGKRQAVRRCGNGLVDLRRIGNGVEMQGAHGKRQSGGQIVTEPAEVGRQYHPQCRRCVVQLQIGPSERRASVASRSRPRTGSSICTHSAPAAARAR